MMNNDEMYAIYNGKEYKCGTLKGGKCINLYSEKQENGFIEFMGTYSKNVDREKCDRVYRKTLCFRYKQDNFLIREEKDGKVLLETGPRSYDLTELGFKRVLNDTFQKWVSKTEGKEYWAYTEY